jgi:predicted lysophospholipase L1 biosynthesis ABC-type transport system permease subunit
VRTADQRESPDERAEVEATLRLALKLRPRDALGVSIQGLQEQSALLEDTWERLRGALWRLALVLAATSSIGVGALQYSVASARRHELGVRRALGARQWQLVRLGAASSTAFTTFATASGAAIATLGAYVTCYFLEMPMAGVCSAIAIGFLPALLTGALSGSLTFGHFARQSPAALIGKPQ